VQAQPVLDAAASERAEQESADRRGRVDSGAVFGRPGEGKAGRCSLCHARQACAMRPSRPAQRRSFPSGGGDSLREEEFPFREEEIPFGRRSFPSGGEIAGKGACRVGIMSGVLRLALVALVATGFVALATPRLAQATLDIAHDDQVHYVGHLVAGRLFSLCPCTLRLADEQYTRGLYHARTPKQVALLTTERSASPRAAFAETPRLVAGALRHIGRRVSG
jgi:hypothetical protein